MSIFYKSDLIITNYGPPLREGIVELNEDGLIVSVFQDDSFQLLIDVKTSAILYLNCYQKY